MSHCYDYPRPAVTVDCAVFGYDKDRQDLQVLLIERGSEPFKGSWALPGGFVDMEESCARAAARELKEETGVDGVFLEQLYTFSEPGRDPRGRVISIAYYGLVPYGPYKDVQGSDDAAEARWFSVAQLPDLAFDHDQILETAINRLRNKIAYAPIGFELLPETFTMAELQRFHETILGRAIERRKFRRRMMVLKVIEDTGEKQRDVSHRPATLYRLNQGVYKELLRQGYPFEF